MGTKAKFDRDDILYHPSLPVVYAEIRRLAKELAVLGKIDIASEITDLLLSQNQTKHGFSLMKFLSFAFEQTGNWPSAIPQSARSRTALGELEIPLSGPLDEERYDKLINETEVSQRNPALCLSIAVGLCEKRGKTKAEEILQDERVLRAIEQITDHFHGYIDTLIQHRRVWPLLTKGAMADHLGVDDATLCATAEDIVKTVRLRLEGGRRKGEHEGKPIKKLLEMLVENTKNNAGPLYQYLCQDPPDSYLHEPATESDIKDVEGRLKISSLPADYKEFLLASNGLESVYDGQRMLPPLVNTQNIVLHDDKSTVEVPLELVDCSTGTAQLIRETGYDTWPSITRGVEIGRMNECVYVLVDPSDTKATIKAYKKALASDEVSEAMKIETPRAIDDLYGSMQAFEKTEWAMIETVEVEPLCPVGTFRSWLEETVRGSAKAYDVDSRKSCLAYRCKAK